MSDTKKQNRVQNMETSPWKGSHLPAGVKTFTVKTNISTEGLPLLERATAGAKISKEAREKLEKALEESGMEDGVFTIGAAESSGTFKIVGNEEAIRQLITSMPDLELCE